MLKLLSKEEINKLSFKNLKNTTDEVDLRKYINDKSLTDFISNLSNDSRKNISGLGQKLDKKRINLLIEIERVKGLYNFDKSFGDYKYIAGVDEVGRGPLAGPIVACAVILDLDVIDDDLILGLNDSKKLSEKKREELAEIIKEKALTYHIAELSNHEIDEKGIAYCNNQVFLNCCNSLKVSPNLVLSDGYLVKNIKYPNNAVIKGDTKSASIAAASIVAKVYRDNLMKEYSKKYSYYGFEDNAGYGTAKHVDGIKNHGVCEIHRRSFLTNILYSE